MIRGLGVDLVETARVAAALERFGRRFAERVLASGELEDYLASPRPAHFLARRFAAKEAMVKALGTGFRAGISPRDIAVVHDEAGRPAIACSGLAAELMRRQGLTALVSLSDERHYALACVVLESAAA